MSESINHLVTRSTRRRALHPIGHIRSVCQASDGRSDSLLHWLAERSAMRMATLVGSIWAGPVWSILRGLGERWIGLVGDGAERSSQDHWRASAGSAWLAMGQSDLARTTGGRAQPHLDQVGRRPGLVCRSLSSTVCWRHVRYLLVRTRRARMGKCLRWAQYHPAPR